MITENQMISHFKIYNINDLDWDTIVKSFSNYDVYYLNGYLKSFYIHGDGEPQLMFYENVGLRAVYVYMKRTISEGIYDSITPYGYGGVLFEGNISEVNLRIFKVEYDKFMMSEHIVDNFVRYHPVLGNVSNMKSISNIIDLGKTIAIDLASEDTIWTNFTSKNRNMIRKAEKNGVEIHHGKSLSLFKIFISIYNSTMDRDCAEEYYYFEQNFYESIHNDLNSNYEMFYAIYQGQVIAMSIIIFANKLMHYHLSGSLMEYKYLAPSNLLLYKTALWGCKQGFKIFHLGGGVGSGEDSLYKFKAAFNKKSNLQFSIGKDIFDQKKYDKLVLERINEDPSFDYVSNYFPLYRS